MWGWIFLGLALPCIYAGVSLAPWVPTRKADILRLIQVLQLRPGERFLEIGSGDARVCSAVAIAFPQTQVTGIELAFPFYLLGYIRKIFSRNTNLSLMLGNALKQDFGSYEVIYIFGMPEKLREKILPKYIQEAKPGTRFISYVFSLPENPQLSIETFGKQRQSKIHIATKI